MPGCRKDIRRWFLLAGLAPLLACAPSATKHARDTADPEPEAADAARSTGGRAGTGGASATPGTAGAGGVGGGGGSNTGVGGVGGAAGGGARDAAAAAADAARTDAATTSADAAPAASKPISVLTHKYDPARTGWNPNEKLLTPARVGDGRFGKLFTKPVDGNIYAQPLVVANLNVGGKVRNVVYVVTMNNTLYAFDADDGGAAALFMLNVGPPAPTGNFGAPGPVIQTDNIYPVVGTTATPVIDPASSTIYFTSKHYENGGWAYRLNAVDVVTGKPKRAAVAILGSVPGTGDGSQNGTVAFDPRYQLSRPGLLLQGGRLYIGFGAHSDVRPYHGWVFTYDAATLQRLAVFCTTPNSWGGGVWSSGIGLVGDGTYVYFATGNGAARPDANPPELSEAFVKLDRDLKVVDWHVRGNYQTLDQVDLDYGMGGPLLIDKASVLLMGGKDSWTFVYDKANLGKYRADDSNTLQRFKGTGASVWNGMHSGSYVYWEGPLGPMIFGWPGRQLDGGGSPKLMGFKLVGRTFDETPALVGTEVSVALWSNGIMVISSDGSSNGILWSSQPLSEPNTHPDARGKLRAYDATNLKVLWDSTTNKARDDVGNFAEFDWPTVANGKVYMPSWASSTRQTGQGALVVYGLMN